MAEMTLERGPAQVKVKRLLDKLEKKPMTAPEIAEFLHLSLTTARTYIRILRDRQQIHVKRWTTEPVCGLIGRPRPVYVAGSGKDAPAPPKTRNEAHKRWYKKMKKDPARHARFLAQCRHRYQKKVFKPRPDVAADWIRKTA